MNSLALTAFDSHPRTRVVFGPDTLDRTGELAAELGARGVLLVTDPGIVAAGHCARLMGILERHKLNVILFDQVRENPTTACVNACLKTAQAGNVEAIIGLGGGSSIDTAKGCNFLLTNGGRMEDYWGVGKARQPMLPLIAIPTTAGTGSECQSFALIADEKTHQKMACGDPKAAARVAILDPGITLSQPPRVTARTGIDAIAHALETAVTTRRNAHSLLYSAEAFQQMVQSFPDVLARPGDLVARGQMLLGAAWAGTAIENSMLGAAHAAANPLTAHYGVIHGEAVGLMLPYVLRFNARQPASRETYAQLARAAGVADPGLRADDAAERLVRKIEQLLDLAAIPRSLKELEIDAADIPMLADEAAKQWTASFNPRPVDRSDFAAFYEQALALRPEEAWAERLKAEG